MLFRSYPGPLQGTEFLESTLYTLSYIVNTPVEKLYTFIVTKDVLAELEKIAEEYRRRFIDRKFKSLEILREAQAVMEAKSGMNGKAEIPY